MRTAPARRQPRERGFTLIEILVVVVIIAILAVVATLSIGVLGGDTEIEDETRRLADAVALLQEQAQLEGRDYGLRIDTGGYEFLRFDGRQLRWVAVEQDAWLRPRELPPGLSFELLLEGKPVLLRRPQRPEARLPQLVAYGSGEMTPYQLSVVRPDAARRVTLIGRADGSIEVARDEDG